MLKKVEVATLLTYLAGAFPGKLKFPTGTTAGDDAMILAYQRAMGDISADIATAAADKYIGQGTEWPPSAGQLAAEARKLAGSEFEKTGAEAWEELQRAYVKHSPFYQYAEFMHSLSEPVQIVVRMIGIDTIDRTDPAYMQPRFIKQFEEQQKIMRERGQVKAIQGRLTGTGSPKLGM